jgi:hypothetical protein
MIDLDNDARALATGELDIVSGGVVQIQSMSSTIQTPGGMSDGLLGTLVGRAIGDYIAGQQQAAHNSGRPPA